MDRKDGVQRRWMDEYKWIARRIEKDGWKNKWTGGGGGGGRERTERPIKWIARRRDRERTNGQTE